MAEWGKLYGSLHGAPEWRAATKGARALWTTALSWCIDQEGQDGAIPRHMLRVLDGTASEAACLVQVGLWEVTDEGWRIRNYENRQRTKDRIDADRESARERKRRSRASRRDTPRDSRGTDAVSHASRGEESREETTTRPSAAPPDTFDAWWSAYPRKEGKGQAVRAYRAAIKGIDPEKLLTLTRQWFTDRPDLERKFTPLPASWLNGQRWADERPQVTRAAAPTSPWDRAPRVVDGRIVEGGRP